MPSLCFTIDLDRDANIPIPGLPGAGSRDRGSGNAPRFSSTEQGLIILIDLLEEMDIPATFFAETETLMKVSRHADLFRGHEVGIHGWAHEEMESLGEAATREMIQRSADKTEEIIGIRPNAFRAPYMKANRWTADILKELGIRTDSSQYCEMSSKLMPYKLENGTIELPVPEGRDASGRKISAYMWPMHEGRRTPDQYIEMASQTEEGVFVIATHTWHMVESADRGPMFPTEAKGNKDNVREVLDGLLNLGMNPLTVSDAAKLCLKDSLKII